MKAGHRALRRVNFTLRRRLDGRRIRVQVLDRSSRWYARYLAVFGVGTVAAVATIGLIRGPVVAAVWSLLWTVFVVGLSWYVLRRPVKPRGSTGWHFASLIAMFALYMPALQLGVTVMADTWWWYPAAAPVVALPFFIGACYWAVRA